MTEECKLALPAIAATIAAIAMNPCVLVVRAGKRQFFNFAQGNSFFIEAATIETAGKSMSFG